MQCSGQYKAIARPTYACDDGIEARLSRTRASRTRTMLLVVAAALATLVCAALGSPTKRWHQGPPSGWSPGEWSSAPMVKIKNGTIAGVHSPAYNEDFFLGIPFAQPPVDQLRFHNPVSINTTFNGTLQATEYAPECVGYGSDQIDYPVSEDCLYLNVIRPSGCEDDQSLPVAVWIHGGGLYEGGTQDRRYNLSFIVDNSVRIGKPIIAVSIAYRLSAWGFLSSQEVTDSSNSNFGLRDQRLALHWVHENIRAFGGDPKQVTIWGESSGAASVGWHLTAYNGRDDGLFRAGIMESGNPVNYFSYRTPAQNQPVYDAMVLATGCAGATDSLNCLRHVPFENLNAVLNVTAYQTFFQPIVDGDFIQAWGSVQLAEGAFVKVPIIDGANTDEGTAFSPIGVNSDADFLGWVTSSFLPIYLPDSLGEEALSVYPNVPTYWIPPVAEIGNITYPPIPGSQYRRSAAYFGDVVNVASRRGTCETWAANGVTAYSYRFNTIPAGVPSQYGVTHFTEVAFVFDNTNGYGYDAAHGTINPFTNKSESYYQLAELMSSSWASFIYDLDPNGFRNRFPGAPQWPIYTVDEPQNIVWDANVSVLADVEDDTWRQEGISWIWEHAADYKH